jgi:hypothetical protein
MKEVGWTQQIVHLNKARDVCTYHVTLRRFRATIVAVEKLWILRIRSVYL